MKKLVLLTAVLLLIFSLFPISIQAQGISSDDENESGAVVCAPDDYLNTEDDCLQAGPSLYRAQMASLGLTLPQRPLPAVKPDFGLTALPYRYFKLEDDVVPILSGAAGNETGQSFLPGFVYVSYIDRVDTGHGI